MSQKEFEGYVDAANKMEKAAEPKQPGLSGEAAASAAKNDPAIRIK